MLHLKSCNVKHNSERVFRCFASAVKSSYRVEKCNRKDLYAICSFSRFNKSVTFLCTPFANRCLIYSDWAFEVTLHSSSARRDSPCVDSPERDSPDHRSVRNKEIKFI